MKKMLIALLCIGAVFTACELENESGNGTENKNSTLTVRNNSSYGISSVSWKGNVIKYGNSLTIPNHKDYVLSGSGMVQDGSDYLYFTREGDSVIKLRTQDTITVSGDTSFDLTNRTMVVEVGNTSNTGVLSAIKPGASGLSTGLRINNQSFSELLNVQWQGVTFASNTVENSIPVGRTVEKEAAEGSGYIFFKRKSNPAFARTKDPITVTEGEIFEFTFNDNTLIVEANNPDNTGTLKDMKTTVLFFDDAEGEIQNYAERKNSDYYSSGDSYRHSPYKNTGKSIYLGGGTDCKLRLSITLEKKGKLSFRFANGSYADENIGAISIDGVEKTSWIGDYSWSYLEYSLEPGSHEIVWTKHGYTYGSVSYESSYLSLDDILVVLDTE